MHYFKRNIGDYHKKAGRLSMLEHGAYTLLLDACYDRERFPTRAEAIDWCWARSVDEVSAVEFVLSKFFTLDGEQYIQARIQEEIAAYHLAKKNHWATKLTKAERAAIQAARNAAKCNATPAWLTSEHKREIAAMYATAAIRTAMDGIPYEVDHIAPLRGKLVCGLHAPWNLRVITAAENRKKSNFEVPA